MRTGIAANNMFKYSVPSPQKANKRRLLLIAAGLVIGAINGLFGSGGGMLVVPALAFIAGLDDRHAHATAIAIVLPLCAVSSVVYALGGGYDYSVFAPTILGVLAGGVLGAALLKKTSNNILPFIFYGLMLFAGIKMLI